MLLRLQSTQFLSDDINVYFTSLHGALAQMVPKLSLESVAVFA